jgi:ribonuclease HI
VKTAHIVPLHRQVLSLAGKFERIRYEHVPRERNTEPDRLANEGVDRMLGERR